MSITAGLLNIEDIKIGEKQSRVSTAIFGILCAIPVISAILFGAVDSITWALLAVFWTAIVILWLVEGWRANGLIIQTSYLQVPLIALVLIGVVQLMPFGTDTAGALLSVPAKHSLSLDPYETRAFVRSLIIFFTFLVACQTFINTESRVRRTTLLVVIFGSLMAFFGILQHIANVDGIYGLRVPFQANPFGPFVNEHHFAAFMEMTGGLALGLIFGSAAKEKKFLLGIALVIMVAALIMTSSRGGMLSFAATTALASAMSFVYRRRYAKNGESLQETRGLRSQALIIAGVLGTIVVVVGLVLFLGGDESLTRGIGLTSLTTDDISNGRLHFWNVAIQIFLDHPVLGAGFNSYGVAFTRYDTWIGVFRVEQAHNDYLQMLADGGILAFGCIVSFIVLFFRKAFQTISSAKAGFRREAAIGALAGCFGILIHSFFDFPLRTSSNAFFFLLLVTVATVAVRGEDETPKRRKRRSSEPSH